MKQPHRLKQHLWDQILKTYKVLDHFDFLDNDFNPALFYDWVKQWQNYNFASNERLVVIDTDTDYYPEKSFGNNLYNFFTCCREFSIPTEFIIFVSGTFNKTKEIKQITDYFNLGLPTIYEHLYLNQHTPIQADIRNVDFNQDKIQRMFFCLNGTLRSYRGLFLCHLADLNLLDTGYFGYYFKSSIKTNPTNTVNAQSDTTVTLRSTCPSSRINDFFKKSPNDIRVFDNYFNLFNNKNMTITDFGLNDHSDIWCLQPDFLQHGLINIVTETAYNYPYPYMSEKTIKPILLKRAFIHLSGAGMLDVLKSFGFKTFDNIWDESYDSINDPSHRLQAVVALVQTLSKQDINELTTQVRDIVEYNYNHYIASNFKDIGMIRY